MSEKRFVMVEVEDELWEYGTPTKYVLQDNQTGKQYEYVSRIVDLLNGLVDENEQLKNINNQIDEEFEVMTNMECLLLIIPFGILFVLLTGIIIAFLVQLGWLVI